MPYSLRNVVHRPRSRCWRYSDYLARQSTFDSPVAVILTWSIRHETRSNLSSLHLARISTQNSATSGRLTLSGCPMVQRYPREQGEASYTSLDPRPNYGPSPSLIEHKFSISPISRSSHRTSTSTMGVE